MLSASVREAGAPKASLNALSVAKRSLAFFESAFISAMQLIPSEVPEADCVLATRPDLVNYYAHRRSKPPPLNSVPDPQFAAMARSSIFPE